jgi:hypothetical protein
MARLLVNIVRFSSDCTLNGITSSQHPWDTIWLCDNEHEAKEIYFKDGEPSLWIQTRKIMGEIYKHAEPPYPKKYGYVGFMSGGNKVYSDDPLYLEMVGHSKPLKVHDREETKEMYQSYAN